MLPITLTLRTNDTANLKLTSNEKHFNFESYSDFSKGKI